MRAHKKPVNPRPSEFVAKFAEEIAVNANGLIIDVACGYGRNASLLSSYGVPVLCVDNDRKALDFVESLVQTQQAGRNLLPTLELDLNGTKWPFEPESLGGIISVHFLTAKILDYFRVSLKVGGYLLIETIGGNGKNYLDLLPQGYIKSRLTDRFDIISYRENKVGPAEIDAASVKLFARRVR